MVSPQFILPNTIPAINRDNHSRPIKTSVVAYLPIKTIQTGQHYSPFFFCELILIGIQLHIFKTKIALLSFSPKWMVEKLLQPKKEKK
jgi:hypothetical protein